MFNKDMLGTILNLASKSSNKTKEKKKRKEIKGLVMTVLKKTTTQKLT